jgi:hypothetical protein
MHIITYKEKVYAYRDNEQALQYTRKLGKTRDERWGRFLILFTNQEHICEDKEI